jgi:hypothetical protein
MEVRAAQVSFFKAGQAELVEPLHLSLAYLKGHLNGPSITALRNLLDWEIEAANQLSGRVFAVVLKFSGANTFVHCLEVGTYLSSVILFSVETALWPLLSVLSTDLVSPLLA